MVSFSLSIPANAASTRGGVSSQSGGIQSVVLKKAATVRGRLRQSRSSWCYPPPGPPPGAPPCGPPLQLWRPHGLAGNICVSVPEAVVSCALVSWWEPGHQATAQPFWTVVVTRVPSSSIRMAALTSSPARRSRSRKPNRNRLLCARPRDTASRPVPSSGVKSSTRTRFGTMGRWCRSRSSCRRSTPRT